MPLPRTSFRSQPTCSPCRTWRRSRRRRAPGATDDDAASEDVEASDGDRALALARRWVLTGGEDHGFLAAVPAGADPLGATTIGRVRSVTGSGDGPLGSPGVCVDGAAPVDSGLVRADPDGGFRHFSGVGSQCAGGTGPGVTRGRTSASMDASPPGGLSALLTDCGVSAAGSTRSTYSPSRMGTPAPNLYHTVRSAYRAVESLDGAVTLPDVIDAMATGAQRGARGNSGHPRRRCEVSQTRWWVSKYRTPRRSRSTRARSLPFTRSDRRPGGRHDGDGARCDGGRGTGTGADAGDDLITLVSAVRDRSRIALRETTGQLPSSSARTASSMRAPPGSSNSSICSTSL